MRIADLVKKLQGALNKAGEKLTEDGVLGPKTASVADQYEIEITVTKKKSAPPPPAGDRPVNPAYQEAKKHEGKTEFMPAFNAWLSGFWPKAGLPGYKTIIGTSFAWCGLFVLAMNSEVGQDWVKGAAGARNWSKYGVAFDWKQNGIPRGAVVHINGQGNCASSSGNHVTFADGDCTAADLKKSGASFPGFGGNQGNAVKRSNYPVKNICAVRWPSEIPLPSRVDKSVDCQSKPSDKESTR